ncbi:thioredoxin fold domain-containing protein [Fulvivirgaceae bacterium BMA10]|uniref:Thioredoxin fold domain-containing protein n=1 Tax=Splendidivirga corallicola TaxID=3051826 RepID=A0ABT8KV35_9BACT|nr:thioredoxin fold domain-containing protein [Fulvivirgaceae bacterium BMA10]
MFKNNLTFSIAACFLVVLLTSAVMESDRVEEDKIEWLNIEEAQKLAKENPRKIFIDVYTDWCGWCKRMDKTTFENAEVAKYVNENYYAVKLNAESKKKIKYNGEEMTEQQLARKMRVSGYPTIVLVDENFETPYPVPGYQTPKQFQKMLKQFKEYKPQARK